MSSETLPLPNWEETHLPTPHPARRQRRSTWTTKCNFRVRPWSYNLLCLGWWRGRSKMQALCWVAKLFQWICTSQVQCDSCYTHTSLNICVNLLSWWQGSLWRSVDSQLRSINAPLVHQVARLWKTDGDLGLEKEWTWTRLDIYI